MFIVVTKFNHYLTILEILVHQPIFINNYRIPTQFTFASYNHYWVLLLKDGHVRFNYAKPLLFLICILQYWKCILEILYFFPITTLEKKNLMIIVESLGPKFLRILTIHIYLLISLRILKTFFHLLKNEWCHSYQTVWLKQVNI